MIKVVFWLVLLQIACVPIADAVEDGALVIGTTRTVRSKLLGEDRTLQIYLPQSYESSRRYRRYPVLYIRDGAFTGLSVLASLFDAKSSFDAYIAIDPSWWWDGYATQRTARAALATRKFQNVQLFMASSGEAYPTNYFIDARDVQALAGMLHQKNPAGLSWNAQRYAQESHQLRGK